jgi:hypothetical protein
MYIFTTISGKKYFDSSLSFALLHTYLIQQKLKILADFELFYLYARST